MNAIRSPEWSVPYDRALLEPRPKEVTGVAASAIGPLRILVAHGQDIIHCGVRALLQGHRGCEICGEARTGWEALSEAEKLTPDIAILNLTIPRLNGLEVAKRIRKASPQTEILMVSTHLADELIPALFAAGVRGYVLQTDSDRDLVSAIEALAHHMPFYTARAMAKLLMLNGNRGNQGQLSSRERDVLGLITRGNRNSQAAAVLGISENTVAAHRTNIMCKLQLSSIADLVRYAIRNQIIEA